jgi:hypothetical protein
MTQLRQRSSAFQTLIRALSVFAFGKLLVPGHLTQRAQLQLLSGHRHCGQGSEGRAAGAGVARTSDAPNVNRIHKMLLDTGIGSVLAARS